MSAQPQRIRDHEFDGIREYDNPCPGWWNWILWGSIILCFPYMIVFHFGDWGLGMHQQHDAALAENLRKQFSEIGTLTGDQETILRFMGEPRWLKVGESVFRAQCATCHGPEGAGMVGAGVNLTDESYKNVKALADIATVITNGANNNAMPPWKARLHPNEIVLTAAYVANMRGKNLPSTRGAPEGEQIPPWPPIPAKAPEARVPEGKK